MKDKKNSDYVKHGTLDVLGLGNATPAVQAGNVALQSGASELPWETNGIYIFAADDTTVAYIQPHNSPCLESCWKNGQLIVRAVNNHASLLSAAKKFLAFYDDLSDSNPGFMGRLTLQDYAQWNEAMIELPRAIAKAERTT